MDVYEEAGPPKTVSLKATTHDPIAKQQGLGPFKYSLNSSHSVRPIHICLNILWHVFTTAPNTCNKLHLPSGRHLTWHEMPARPLYTLTQQSTTIATIPLLDGQSTTNPWRPLTDYRNPTWFIPVINPSISKLQLYKKHARIYGERFHFLDRYTICLTEESWCKKGRLFCPVCHLLMNAKSFIKLSSKVEPSGYENPPAFSQLHLTWRDWWTQTSCMCVICPTICLIP